MNENKKIYKIFVKETQDSGYTEVYKSFIEVVENLKNIGEFDEIIISPSKREA